jgi:hypothetical protein
MKQEFINEKQTSQFRKFKYQKCRQAGMNRILARRVRDWQTTACVRTIAKYLKVDFPLYSFQFYRDLKDSGIQPFREESEPDRTRRLNGEYEETEE